MPLLRNHMAKTLQESVGYLAAPTRCTEYQWEKGSMLHLPDAFFVGPSLLLFVLGIGGRGS